MFDVLELNVSVDVEVYQGLDGNLREDWCACIWCKTLSKVLQHDPPYLHVCKKAVGRVNV